jgi:hypothetical protein
MSSTHSYDREGFLSEFFPDADDRAEVEAGAQVLINVSRAHRLAEMRKLSAIERAKVDASELRTLAAYIRALGGRMEIIADFGGERLVVG